MSLGADDYIFKPFDLDDLVKSIELRFQKASVKSKLEEDTNKFKYKNDDKFLFKFSNKMEYREIKDIVIITATPPYVQLKFNNQKISLIRESLSYWEDKLPENFIRINKSTIINIDYVTKVENLDSSSYLIQIQNEPNNYVVSRRYKHQIKKFLLDNE